MAEGMHLGGWLAIGGLLIGAVVVGWWVSQPPALAPPAVTMTVLPPAPEDPASVVGDPRWIAHGRQIFTGFCATCHGQDGRGGQGPNLRDAVWLNPHTPSDLVRLIGDGKPGTAMQPMRAIYSPAELVAVTAYVLSLAETQ